MPRNPDLAGPAILTWVIETTQTRTIMAIIRASASAAEIAVTNCIGTAGSCNYDFADGVATVSTRSTETVTVALASFSETLPLPTSRV